MDAQIAESIRSSFLDLKERDREVKPPTADIEWATLSAYYWDQSREETKRGLRELGVGLKDQRFPIDLSKMLKQAINRQATVYKRAPARWLKDAQLARLPEAGAEHKLLLEILASSLADVSWRLVDRLRTLLEQVAIRFYPSDARQSVVFRLFEPQNMLRDPDPACGDLMDEDRKFALELAGGVFEFWWQTDRRWSMAWVSKEGVPLADDQQPFMATGLASPYDRLPVQMIYADHPAGKPWLPPSQSRQAWVRAFNALSNDTQALVTFQAWRQRVYKRRDPNNKLPQDIGPGATITIEEGEELIDLPASDAMLGCIETLKAFAAFFAIGENLPSSEFEPGGSIVTGAALRVLLAPLLDRREDQVPLVVPDERRAWAKLISVHNTHAAKWDRPTLDPTLVLDLEVPDLEAPTTETEMGNLTSRQLAVGTASTIDLIQREYGCTRDQAIARYERIQKDFALYPPRVAPTVEQTGPRMSEVREAPTPADRAPDAILDGRASVLDALKRASA